MVHLSNHLVPRRGRRRLCHQGVGGSEREGGGRGSEGESCFFVVSSTLLVCFETKHEARRMISMQIFNETQICMQEYASAGKVLSMFELLNGCTFCTKLWAFSPLPPLSYTFKALH